MAFDPDSLNRIFPFGMEAPRHTEEMLIIPEIHPTCDYWLSTPDSAYNPCGRCQLCQEQ